jgi:hypothetical protein
VPAGDGDGDGAVSPDTARDLDRVFQEQQVSNPQTYPHETPSKIYKDDVITGPTTGGKKKYRKQKKTKKSRGRKRRSSKKKV